MEKRNGKEIHTKMLTYIAKTKRKNEKEWRYYSGLRSRNSKYWAKELCIGEEGERLIILSKTGEPLSGVKWNERYQSWDRLPKEYIDEIRVEWYNKKEGIRSLYE